MYLAWVLLHTRDIDTNPLASLGSQVMPGVGNNGYCTKEEKLGTFIKEQRDWSVNQWSL